MRRGSVVDHRRRRPVPGLAWTGSRFVLPFSIVLYHTFEKFARFKVTGKVYIFFTSLFPFFDVRSNISGSVSAKFGCEVNKRERKRNLKENTKHGTNTNV